MEALAVIDQYGFCELREEELMAVFEIDSLKISLVDVPGTYALDMGTEAEVNSWMKGLMRL